MTFFQSWGYIGLFMGSFLAATILPFSPEVLILYLFYEGYNAALLVLVATVAGYFGSLTNYYIGSEGSRQVFKRFFSVPPERIERARKTYEKWGSFVLFFSWLPFVGEPLIMVAGILKVRLPIFTFWVLTGRLVRFAVLLLLADPLVR